MAKVIVFIAAAVATSEEVALLETLKQDHKSVVFRNASFVTDTENPEECDFVAGLVPKVYKDKAVLPSTEEKEEEKEEKEEEEEEEEEDGEQTGDKLPDPATEIPATPAPTFGRKV